MRVMRKVVTVSFTLVVLFAALAALLLSASIYTYHVLTAEAVIAELRFDETGDRQYIAHLRTGDGCEERVLPVLGEQWRMDAYFVKWKYWAMLFGLESQYRLDRLEGRYRSAADQNTAPTLTHDLGAGTTLDVVTVSHALGALNFLLDATYGSSTYTDIDPANVYYVYRTTTGIITRAEPRPPPADANGPLVVDVTHACGGEPPLWRRAATWTDDRVESALQLVSD